MLTLTGTAGTGKTRLAVAAAAKLAHMFADGVRFVNLTSLTHPDDALVAIARTPGSMCLRL